MQEQIHGKGSFETAHARRYLQQLCKHFAHKVDVSYDESSAEVAFPFGAARFSASDDRLEATIGATTEDGLAKARHVIDDHLRRFAFREEFTTMNWAGTA